MEPITLAPKDYTILFDKLEEAKAEQHPTVVLSIEESAEVKETVLLFREFQESMQQSSCTTYDQV